MLIIGWAVLFVLLVDCMFSRSTAMFALTAVIFFATGYVLLMLLECFCSQADQSEEADEDEKGVRAVLSPPKLMGAEEIRRAIGRAKKAIEIADEKLKSPKITDEQVLILTEVKTEAKAGLEYFTKRLAEVTRDAKQEQENRSTNNKNKDD